MLLRMPSYCAAFACVADQCRDSCCIGWEIAVDEQTAAYYDRVEGAFGARLHEHITDAAPRIMRLDERERCPFLNARNLCDIYTVLGEEHLCGICKEHPRYYAWFDGVREGGIGLCCEEAARIILSQTEPFSYTEQPCAEESCEDYSAALYDCLIHAREQMFDYLQNESRPIGERLCGLMGFAQALQSRTDRGDDTLPPITPAPCDAAAFERVVRFFASLEPLDPDWQIHLRAQADRLPYIAQNKDALLCRCPELPRYLQNITVYFLWRHFLKGVFDEEFFSRVFFACASAAVIGFQLLCRLDETGVLTLTDSAEIAKDFSKELEYSEENLNAASDFAYEFFRAE